MHRYNRIADSLKKYKIISKKCKSTLEEQIISIYIHFNPLTLIKPVKNMKFLRRINISLFFGKSTVGLHIAVWVRCLPSRTM